MFQFEVLGSVEIYRNGERLDLKTPKLRTLTAILLCRPNDWTSTSTLIGALWRQHPPDTARKTLQVYIHRLRAHLRANRALSSSKGYKLVVANGELDATSFAELVSCASSLQDTDPIEASRHYVKALALWRGSAFTGHTDNPYIRRHVARLEELRVDAICQFAALEANLGRPESPLDLLFDAVGGHPHSAELSTALMSALDRSGRRADALEVYHRYRKAIQSELGVQPSKPMIELYGRILRSDQLPEGDLVSSGAATRRPVPRQLAHALRQFTGRHKEFERLNSLAKAHGRRVATITGMAGVGKTALVIQWGHSAAAHFPDGQLFLNLRGFGPGEPMTPADAMTSCLGALGVDVNGYGNTTTNLASVYQSTMATRRTLLVLDNARSSEQVKPLIPSNGRHMVLITSRNVLARQLDAEAAVEIALGPFSEEESIRFLEARLGQSFVGSELLDAQRVVASCAHLPLSLAVVAANALARRGTSVSSLAYELSSSSMWRTLRGDDTATNVRSVLSWSYQALSPDAAGLFKVLGIHPGPTVALDTAAYMAALTPKSTRKLLAELIAASMIYEMEHDRYAMHDLLRALALDVVTPNEAVTIRHRMLNHYVATGCAAALSMNRNRAPIPPLPGSLNHQTIHFGSPESAMAWLESEYLTLCQCVDVAESSGHDAHAWRLAWAVSDLSIRRGRSDVLGHISRLALAAGQRLLDRRAQGYAARYLGIATLADGDAEQAARLLNVALDHFAAVDGVLEQAWVHNDLAAMHEHEPAVALRHARRFRALSKRAGHAFSVAAATDCVAWAHLLTGDLNRAFVWTKFALSLNEQHGDLSHGIAGNLHTIGRVSHALGDYESAVASYRKSAQRYKAIGRIAATVLSLRDMSISLHALGRAEEAEVARAEAERERRRLPT